MKRLLYGFALLLIASPASAEIRYAFPRGAMLNSTNTFTASQTFSSITATTIQGDSVTARVIMTSSNGAIMGSSTFSWINLSGSTLAWKDSSQFMVFPTSGCSSGQHLFITAKIGNYHYLACGGDGGGGGGGGGDNLGSAIATNVVVAPFGINASSGIVQSSWSVMGVVTSTTGAVMGGSTVTAISLAGGVVGSPSLYWLTDRRTGLYRGSADNPTMGVSGSGVTSWSAAKLSMMTGTQFQTAAGTGETPSLLFGGTLTGFGTTASNTEVIWSNATPRGVFRFTNNGRFKFGNLNSRDMGATVTIGSHSTIVNLPLFKISSGSIVFEVTEASTTVNTSTFSAVNSWVSVSSMAHVARQEWLDGGVSTGNAVPWSGGILDMPSGFADGVDNTAAGSGTDELNPNFGYYDGAANTKSSSATFLTPFGRASVSADTLMSTITIMGSTWPYASVNIPAGSWTGFGIGGRKASEDNAGFAQSSSPLAYNRLPDAFMEFKNSTRSFAFAHFTVPTDYLIGSTLSYTFDWYGGSGTAQTNVRFCSLAVSVSSGSAMFPVWSSSSCVTSTYKAVNQSAKSSTMAAGGHETSTFTVSGNPAPGDKAVIVIFRDGADGRDTFAGFMWMTNFDVYYRRGKFDQAPW